MIENSGEGGRGEGPSKEPGTSDDDALGSLLLRGESKRFHRIKRVDW